MLEPLLINHAAKGVEVELLGTETVADRAYDDPELEERRLAALRQIRQFGDPALRAQAVPISSFDAALREEAERMVAIMIDAGAAHGRACRRSAQCSRDGRPSPACRRRASR